MLGLDCMFFNFLLLRRKNGFLHTNIGHMGFCTMNTRNFVAPSRDIFEDMHIMEVTVKIVGIPIDCRTIPFGIIMLQPLGYVRDVKHFSA